MYVGCDIIKFSVHKRYHSDDPGINIASNTGPMFANEKVLNQYNSGLKLIMALGIFHMYCI